ncbi:aldo/keto reductase [Caulobacter sp. KR2-114]|uniref:aldo/keto reductase n=1 Tax=Caulobacter sp. KR2-114 TaxID=3400912 RepID=UPI003C1104F6
MEHRKLGRSDIAIAPLMLGGNVFGWTADEATSFAVLDAFVDAGFNAIDTADVYARWSPAGGGASETVIGAWLKRSGKRDKVVIATKFGMEMGEGKKGLSAKWMVEAVEDSLRRLQTDVIDLYQSHADDPQTPQDETMEAYSRLVAAGKVRIIGASNFDAARLQSANATAAAHGWPRYETLQPLYNLYDRAAFEDGLAAACREEQVSVIPYYGLASGFLTGKYRSEADLAKSQRGRGAKKYLDERGLRILGALDEVAAGLSATPAQVALAWLMTKVTAPIASATSVDQLQDLMKAASLKLDASAVSALEAASAPAPVPAE